MMLSKFVEKAYPRLDLETARAIYHLLLGSRIEVDGEDLNGGGQHNSEQIGEVLARAQNMPWLSKASAEKTLLESGMFPLVANEAGPDGWLVFNDKGEIVGAPDKDWVKGPPGMLLPEPAARLPGQVVAADVPRTWRLNPRRSTSEISAWEAQRTSFLRALERLYEKHAATGGIHSMTLANSPRPHPDKMRLAAAALSAAGAVIEEYVNVAEAVRGSQPTGNA